MRRIAILIAIAVVLVMATPVAAGPRERVGGQINVLFQTPSSFPANEPFHIVHGWITDQDATSPPDPLGSYDFELEVDGALREEDFREHIVERDEGLPTVTLLWVHNFPTGMTGTHTFTGHWFAPCQVAVDNGWYPGPCDPPVQKVEAQTVVHTVTFETAGAGND